MRCARSGGEQSRADKGRAGLCVLLTSLRCLALGRALLALAASSFIYPCFFLFGHMPRCVDSGRKTWGNIRWRGGWKLDQQQQHIHACGRRCLWCHVSPVVGVRNSGKAIPREKHQILQKVDDEGFLAMLDHDRRGVGVPGGDFRKLVKLTPREFVYQIVRRFSNRNELPTFVLSVGYCLNRRDWDCHRYDVIMISPCFLPFLPPHPERRLLVSSTH